MRVPFIWRYESNRIGYVFLKGFWGKWDSFCLSKQSIWGPWPNLGVLARSEMFLRLRTAQPTGVPHESQPQEESTWRWQVPPLAALPAPMLLPPTQTQPRSPKAPRLAHRAWRAGGTLPRFPVAAVWDPACQMPGGAWVLLQSSSKSQDEALCYPPEVIWERV